MYYKLYQISERKLVVKTKIIKIKYLKKVTGYSSKNPKF